VLLGSANTIEHSVNEEFSGVLVGVSLGMGPRGDW
jgi:hypothetical protein